MRICHVTSYYQKVIDSFYERNPHLGRASFAQQSSELFAERFGWSDFLQTHLRALGHEAWTIVANNRRAQKQWLAENGSKAGWQNSLATLAMQITQFQPDVVFFEDSSGFPATLITQIRASNPKLRLVVAYVGTSQSHDDFLRRADLVVTCAEDLTESLRASGANVATVHHGFEPRVLEEAVPTDGPLDVSFVGSLMPAFHDDRFDLLIYLCDHLDVAVYSSVADSWLTSLKDLVKATLRGSSNAYLRHVAASRNLRLRAPAYGTGMFSVLRRSRISLNSHGDRPGSLARNMRLFEITGCGACMVTDWRANLTSFFDVGKEVMAFKTRDECLEIMKWLLAHEPERQRIACAGAERTLKDHTFEQRVRRFEEVFLGALN